MNMQSRELGCIPPMMKQKGMVIDRRDVKDDARSIEP